MARRFKRPFFVLHLVANVVISALTLGGARQPPGAPGGNRRGSLFTGRLMQTNLAGPQGSPRDSKMGADGSSGLGEASHPKSSNTIDEEAELELSDNDGEPVTKASGASLGDGVQYARVDSRVPSN